MAAAAVERRLETAFSANAEISAAYINSSPQQLAMHTMLSELLRGDFIWSTTTDKGKSHVKKCETSSKEHHMWSTVVTKVLHNIMIYGFVVYRIVKIKKQDEKKDLMYAGMETYVQPEETRIEIANGLGLVLQWNKDTVGWDVYNNDSDESLLTRKEGWHLYIYSEPIRSEDDATAIPTSAAAKAFSESVQLSRIMKLIEVRDELNSEPSAYTYTPGNVVGSGAGGGVGEDWRKLVSDHLSIGGAVAQQKDPATILRQVLKEAREANKYNEKKRDMVYNSYLAMSKPSADSARPSAPKRARHREYTISVGQMMTEASYLKGPENIIEIIDRLVNNILFTWGIPPQALGKNINSERLASSNELTQMAIAMYMATIKHVRTAVQNVLTILSSRVSGSKNTFVRLWPCVSQYNLDQIKGLLHPTIARELYACAFEIPENYLLQENVDNHVHMSLTGATIEADEQARRLAEAQIASIRAGVAAGGNPGAAASSSGKPGASKPGAAASSSGKPGASKPGGSASASGGSGIRNRPELSEQEKQKRQHAKHLAKNG